MQSAKVDLPRFFYLFSTSLLTSPRVRVLDSASAVLSTNSLASSVTLANLYLSSTSFTFDKAGVYKLVYEDSDGVGGFTPLRVEEVVVSENPDSDVVLSSTVNTIFRLDDAIVGDNTSTVTASIVYQNDTLHEAGDPLTATFDATEGNYKLTTVTPIENAGIYHIIWFDDGVYTHHQVVYAFNVLGLELCEWQIVDTSSGVTVAYAATDVLLSDANGLRVAQSTTNATGYVSFRLNPGEYTVSVRKSNLTFTTNNVKFTVVNTAKVAGSNTFSMNVASLATTFTDFTSSVSVCTLSGTFLKMDGTPLRCAEILIELNQGPSSFSGNGVFGVSMVKETDVNGYVEFDLVQGIEVTVSVMSHSYRRRFTVPSAATADLLTVTSTSPDLFDVVVVDIPTAVSR